MPQTRQWSDAERELITETIKKRGLNRGSFKDLKTQLKCTRHQLRGQLNTMGLTVTGRKEKAQLKTRLNPTDQRVLDLQVKLQQVKRENNELTQQVSALQSNASVITAMKDELHEHVQPFRPLPSATLKPSVNKTVEEDLVMHLSDEHADQVVLPHRVLGMEEYNFRVALARAETYVQRTIQFTQATLSNYRFPTLWLLCYGDHTSGEIHGAVSNSYYRNIFRNSLAIGQMHGLMIRDLAPYFDRVNVICVPGNHGRRTPKKEYQSGAWNNWDYLVHETASLCCQDIKNVAFKIPDAFSVNTDIRGYTFNISHGDDIKSWNSIPYYGIERKTRRLAALHFVANQRIHYFAMGHFHQLSSMQHPGGETLINGSFKLTDEFAYNALGAANEPQQLIHGVHEDHGITWRLNVQLRRPDEKDGPRRYQVRMAEALG